MRIVGALAVACLAAAALAGCAGTDEGGTSPSGTDAATVPAAPPPGITRDGSGGAPVLSGIVTRIIDGDTIRVEVRGFETPVRLLGIDTPETRRPGGAVQCFGPAASERIGRLLPEGRRVRLVTDPSQDTRDRYGRLLAYVYTPGRAGGAGSVNYALVAAGYAKVYVFGRVRFRHAALFEAAEASARRRGLGLWGAPCRGDTSKPDEPRSSGPGTAPLPFAAPASPPSPASACDPGYRGACVPRYPPDVDCADVGAVVTVVGGDLHHLDGNGDGTGCE